MFKIRFICFFIPLLCVQNLYSEEVFDTQDVVSHNNKTQNVSPNVPINLRGIFLIDSREHLLSSTELETYHGVHARYLPGKLSSLENKLSENYLNAPITSGNILEIKEIVEKYFRDNNYPFVLVKVPTQKISDGVLQVVVTISTLEKITVEGACRTTPRLLTRYVSTKPCQPINILDLQNDVSFMNRNPYRHVDLVFAPGDCEGTTQAELVVDERRPVRIYAGADNTGLVRIKRQRLFAGLGFDLSYFNIDHQFNFQYTTAYQPKDLQGYTGQYVAYLPMKHVFNAYGGYSTTQVQLPFPTMSNHGRFGQASLRYTIPRHLSTKVPLEWTFGFDYKNTNTSIFFSELYANSTSKNVNLAQFMTAGRLGFEGSRAHLELTAEIFFSPGAMLPDQSDARYDSLRPGAKPYYTYGKFAARYTQRLPADFSSALSVRGQVSSNALLPSEQYGLGGYDTVRGYDEYQLNMDNALNVNYELRSPSIAVISMIRSIRMKDALQFLIFCDYGFGTNKDQLPGEPSPSYLLSVGPGARYTLDPTVSMRLDWGWKLHKEPNYTGGASEVHFSAILSY